VSVSLGSPRQRPRPPSMKPENTSPERGKRQFIIHPIAVACFPVLSVYSTNFDVVLPQHTVRPLVVLLLASIFLWALLALVTRELRRSALVATSCLLTVFFLGIVYRDLCEARAMLVRAFLFVPLSLVGAVTVSQFFTEVRYKFYAAFAAFIVICVSLDQITLHLQSDVLINASWVIWLTVICCAMMRFRGELRWATSLLNSVSIFLVVLPSGSILWQEYAARSMPPPKDRVSARHLAKNRGLPDVYFIILDEYARADALQKYFDYDNSAFIMALESRGFYIAKRSKSNYARTVQSLASSLNLNYHDSFTKSKPLIGSEILPYLNMIDDHCLSWEFKKAGYKTVSIMSEPDVIRNTKVDLAQGEVSGLRMLEYLLLRNTPFGPVSDARGSREYARRKISFALESLETLRPSKGPKFVFSHILCPHGPYVFKADGSMPKESETQFGEASFLERPVASPGYATWYLQQVKFINSRMLRIVDSILDKSPNNPPIIVIQGDHGSRSRFDHEHAEKADLSECFPILNAVLVPESMRPRLYPELSPVNTFRLILSALTGANLPLLPDRSFYSTVSQMYDFVEVPPESIESGLAKENVGVDSAPK
jgi:hypothetical protein